MALVLKETISCCGLQRYWSPLLIFTDDECIELSLNVNDLVLFIIIWHAEDQNHVHQTLLVKPHWKSQWRRERVPMKNYFTCFLNQTDNVILGDAVHDCSQI